MPAPRRTIDEVLRSTALLGAADTTTLATMAEASRWRSLQRDDILFVEGDRPSAVYAVAAGTLRVFTSTLSGNEPTFTLLSEGSLVGELGVLDDVPRSASVGALRKAEIVEIPARVFRAAYQSDPAIARRLVVLLSERLRALSDGMADLTYLDLAGRLAKYLLGEVDRQGTTTFRLTLTQAELGQMLGGARQSVNQTMQSLERLGLVAIDGRSVTVRDLDGLRRRAS